MIPVKHAPHRSASKNIRGFREIRNSTFSRRLFADLEDREKLSVHNRLFQQIRHNPLLFDYLQSSKESSKMVQRE